MHYLPCSSLQYCVYQVQCVDSVSIDQCHMSCMHCVLCADIIVHCKYVEFAGGEIIRGDKTLLGLKCQVIEGGEQNIPH